MYRRCIKLVGFLVMYDYLIESKKALETISVSRAVLIFININLLADQVYQISQIRIEFQQEILPENPQWTSNLSASTL